MGKNLPNADLPQDGEASPRLCDGGGSKERNPHGLAEWISSILAASLGISRAHRGWSRHRISAAPRSSREKPANRGSQHRQPLRLGWVHNLPWPPWVQRSGTDHHPSLGEETTPVL